MLTGIRVSTRICLSGLCLLLATLIPSATAHADGKVALVIGNGAYQAMPSLRNPANDADLMAHTLSSLGFDVVQIIDGDRRDFQEGLTRFGRKAQGVDIALVYYAGHGVQVNGRNWLLPVDARIQASTDLPAQALRANDLLEIMEASGAKLKLVFFDACRNNPLPRSLSRGAGNGLARLEANAAGMMIAFATSPGDVALDGAGRNSPFTEALARLITTPDLEVRLLMGRVRESVYTSTGERQLPWLNDALIGEYYFGGRSSDGTAFVPAPSEPAPANSGNDDNQSLALSTQRHQPLPAYAGDACRSASARGSRFEVCASSVLDPQHGNRYGPANLFDADPSTAWVEGVTGNGSGEKVLISFGRPRLLAGFDIINGYAKNRDIYAKNARVRTATITLSNGRQEKISLSDTMRSSRFGFAEPIEVEWLEFEIGSVFPGSKYADTALSEFTPVFND